MKKKLLVIVFFITFFNYSQTATEIYLFDLVQNDSVFTIDNPLNISNNIGYDNQPSFLFDGSGILYASNRFDQTDVVLYNLINQTKAWLSNTPGSEYSPTQTPNKKYFSTIY